MSASSSANTDVSSSSSSLATSLLASSPTAQSTTLFAAVKAPVRAQLRLASFPITGPGSSKLADFLTYLKSVRTIETSNTKSDPKTDAAASAKRLDNDQSNNIESVAICVAKYLKFESSVDSADQLDLLTELRNKTKLVKFLDELRAQQATFNTIVNYLRSLEICLDYLAQDQLSVEQRNMLHQTREWYKQMKKTRQRAGTKETKKRNSREIKEAAQQWASLEAVRRVADTAQTRVQEMVNQVSNASAPHISVDTAVTFRQYAIVLILLKGKSCRKKVYANMRLDQWNSLPRDDMGRKVMVSDQFKTANTYNVDTVVFKAETETLINNYVRFFRPVLVKQATDAVDCGWLWLTKDGAGLQLLSKDVQRVFLDIVGKDITITTLRKIIATEAAAGMSSEEQQLLAKNDTHSPNTVREWYEKKTSYHVAAQALDLQHQLLFGAEPLTTSTGSSATSSSSSSSSAGSSSSGASSASSSASSASSSSSFSVVVPATSTQVQPTLIDDDMPSLEEDCDSSSVVLDQEKTVADDVKLATHGSNTGVTSSHMNSQSDDMANTAPNPIVSKTTEISPRINPLAAHVQEPSIHISKLGPAPNARKGNIPKASGTYNAEMDALIFDAGQQRWRWGDLKTLRPDLFGHLSAEQLRQRWRNLQKKRDQMQPQPQHQPQPQPHQPQPHQPQPYQPQPHQPQPQPHQHHHQQQHQQQQSVPLPSRGTKRKHLAIVASLNNPVPQRQHPLSIIDQRVINGVLYFKCETQSGGVTWLSESDVDVQ